MVAILFVIFLSFFLFTLWCMLKVASIADHQMEQGDWKKRKSASFYSKMDKGN